MRERDDQSRDDLDFLSVDTSFLVLDRERDFDRECDFERFRERDRDRLLFERLLLRDRRLRERRLRE